MARSRCRVALWLALAIASPAHAGADDEWLDGAAAREFRQRVAQLAVIYGDSRGIDPRGLLVMARRIDEVHGDCADVDIVVIDGPRELRHEQVHACRHGT